MSLKYTKHDLKECHHLSLVLGSQCGCGKLEVGVEGGEESKPKKFPGRGGGMPQIPLGGACRANCVGLQLYHNLGPIQ